MAELASEGEIKKGPFSQYPEGSDLPGVRFILEKSSALSRRSRIKTKKEGEDGYILGSVRPDALRRTRRELAEKIKSTTKEERVAIIEKAHARDELAERFITNQQEVRVDMGELGEQMARFIVLTPPESRKAEETDSKPPIFLISGISNDLESMGSLPQEIAFQGRKVITIAYPESWHGDVTDAFGRAVEESSSYEPHTLFFKRAIENIGQNADVKKELGDYSKIELWGWSAGALMVSEMLTDKDFGQKISDAVIIAPASNLDRKISNLKMPVWLTVLVEELQSYASNFKNSAKLNPNNRTNVEYTKDKRKRMQRTFNALAKKVLRKNNWWEQDMDVSQGGKIVVVSYNNDRMTGTSGVVNEIRKNPKLNLIELSGSHTNPRNDSEVLISKVGSALNTTSL